MSSAHRDARIGAATSAALTLVALALLDTLVQQQLGASLDTAAVVARAGPGVIALGGLEPGAAAMAAVDLAQACAALSWQYGGALVVGLGTAGVLLNGVAARMAAWIEGRVWDAPGRVAPAR